MNKKSIKKIQEDPSNPFSPIFDISCIYKDKSTGKTMTLSIDYSKLPLNVIRSLRQEIILNLENNVFDPSPPYCPGCKCPVPEFGDVCQTCRSKFNTCTCIEDGTVTECMSKIHDCCCIQVTAADCMAKKNHACVCSVSKSERVYCNAKTHE